MKIAIEGLDGSGKTVLSKAICEKLNYLYITKPFTKVFDMFNLTEEQIRSMEWSLYETQDHVVMSLFYGFGLLYASRCIEHHGIVYDRHYASNYYWHGNEENSILHSLFVKYGGKPDLTIVLKADTEIRLDRMKKRNKHDADLSNSDMYINQTEKLVSFLEDNKMPYITIDTNNKSQDEVLTIALDQINKIICQKRAGIKP